MKGEYRVFIPKRRTSSQYVVILEDGESLRLKNELNWLMNQDSTGLGFVYNCPALSSFRDFLLNGPFQTIEVEE